MKFTQEKETLLATLYGRALDARAQRPILGDTLADEVVRRIDYDFARLKVNPKVAASVVVRAKFFDRWAREFLAAHKEATVVHLGAGLDTRAWRLDPGPGVAWYDVDYPEVVEVRRQLLPERQGFHTVGSSVTDAGWERQIPAGRPTLILAEGLTMYLKAEAGHELFRRLTAHFGTGVIAVDVFNSTGIKMQKLNPPVRLSGSTLYWGVDDPHELEREVPGLRLTDAVSALYAPGTEELPRGSRLIAQLLRPFPSMRSIGRYLRYTFGAA